MIRPGDVLQIPYLVKPGDTAFSIAARFGISIQHLAYNNGQGMEILNTRPPKDKEPEDEIPMEYRKHVDMPMGIDPVTGIPYY